MLRPLLALLAFASLLSSPALAQPAAPIRVVASFSLLGDMIREIGGSTVELTVLVGPDMDAHDFQPSPQQARALAGAEIIAINGLKYEGWIGKLIDASGSKAKLLVASAGVKPRVVEESQDGQVIVDPHAWQDLRNAQLYVKNIAAALSATRPALAPLFDKRAEAYSAQLAALDKETRQALAAIPEHKRKIITSHDAFGYFGAAYGVTFLSPMGISTETEPSAAAVAKLIDQIKQEGVKEVFIENMTSPRLIQQIGKDAGARLGGTLYADALSGPDGDAPTFLALFVSNRDKMLQAMK